MVQTVSEGMPSQTPRSLVSGPGSLPERQEKRSHEIDRNQVDIQRERLSGFLDGEVNPSMAARALQRTMWEGAGIFRTADGLSKGAYHQHLISHISGSMPSARITCSNAARWKICAPPHRSSSVPPSCGRSPGGLMCGRDIRQDWDAAHSPYGHTFLSLTDEGIETGVRS